MSVIPPPSPRCIIENTSPSLIITIPSRRHWFLTVYLVLLLGVFAAIALPVGGMLLVGALFPLAGLLGGSGSAVNEAVVSMVIAGCGMGLSLLAFVGMLLAGGLYVLYLLLWQLTGVEKIEVDSQAITVQHLMLKTLRVGRPKIHSAEHVKELRAVPSNTAMWWWWRSMYLWGLMDGSIAFDYGAKTFRYGSGVDEAEAKNIVRAILERFPQYQTK